MEKTFIQVRSVKDIVISSVLIAFGGLLIIFPTSPALNITGSVLISTGILLAFVLKSGFKDLQTGELYLKKEHYFQNVMNAQLASAIATKPESVDLTQEDVGNSIRLDIYFSKTTNKAYIQLYKYIPYRYEPCTTMFEYELNRVGKLIS